LVPFFSAREEEGLPTRSLPGLIDVHVHLREPGGTHKEDMDSGSAAALAGGVTLLLDMPNTTPAIIDRAGLAQKRRLARQRARCDVGFFVGAAEANAQDAARLACSSAGLKLYLDATYGPLRVQELPVLLTHFQSWPREKPIAVHAEGLSAALAIGLAHAFGRRLHVCHVSRADELSLIRAAKERGMAVTCEVTPHHLWLTEADARQLGPYGFMKPELGSQADRVALWANLDLVDCIATDHAPHTRLEKESDAPPPGVPGLETTLPLLLTAVAEGRLGLERLVELTHTAPARIFGLPAQPDTWVEVDPDTRHTLHSAGLHTKCGWTPFEGLAVRGRVRRVVLRGHVAFEDGEVRATPGTGRPLFEPLEGEEQHDDGE
jgi:dihydroorotase